MPRPNEYANNMGGVGQYPPLTRYEILSQAQGFVTQNFERQASQGGQIAIDGTAYFMLVGLRAGDIVANISLCLSTAGATPTISKVGLYTKTGTQLGVSNDLGSLWMSGSGIKTGALVTPYTVPYDDAYYAAFLSKAATVPTFIKGGVSGAIPGGSPGALPCGTQSGLTDLTGPATIGQASIIAYWVGIS